MRRLAEKTAIVDRRQRRDRQGHRDALRGGRGAGADRRPRSAAGRGPRPANSAPRPSSRPWKSPTAQSFAAAIDRAIRLWGRLDILGEQRRHRPARRALQDTSLEQFEQLVDVNLRSVFLGWKLAYPHLKVARVAC